MLADIVLSVQGLISQSIIDTLRSAIESGNVGGLQVEIVPGTVQCFHHNVSLMVFTTDLKNRTRESIPSFDSMNQF